MSIARIVYMLVRSSGLPWLFRTVLFRRRTRILVFHDPAPEAFARAVRYLAKRYSLIALDEHLSGRTLPPRPLVITFDDGHAGNHALLEVLREHRIRPTIFLCSGLIGTRRHFWFKHTALRGATEPFKKLPDAERLLALRATGFSPDREFDTPQALSRDQVEDLRAYADLQSHSVFHPCLPQCDDHTALEEIVGSKRALETMLNSPVKGFAFPNGDYSERDIALLKAAGYRYACTVDHGFNRSGEDLFRLKRLSVDDSGNLDALSAKASGVWALLSALFRGRRLSGFKERPMATTASTIAFPLVLLV